MADGSVCRNCGYQETDHELGRAKLPNGEECLDFEVDEPQDADAHDHLRERLLRKLGTLEIGESSSIWEDG